MSLLDAAERFASLDHSRIVLHAEHCLHSLDRHSECQACFQVCPAGAIVSGKPPTLHPEECQSCLACLPVCPAGAYHGGDEVADLLNCATHVEDQPVEILCGQHPQPQSGADANAVGIQVHGCLAGVGTGAYLSLSALGVRRILPRTDACQACRWGMLLPQIKEHAEQANRVLSAWGRQDAVVCMDELVSPAGRTLWNARNPPLSRRDLFHMMARQGQIAMARAMANGTPASEARLGRDRLRLLSAVSHLPDPPERADISLEGMDFASLTVSEACTACGACGRACPSQALRFEKDEEALTFSLFFSPQHCIGCSLCDHVCLPDAIRLDRVPAWDEVFGHKEPVPVMSGPLARCERCRTFIAKREGVLLCSLCEYRRAQPFGSMIPQKVKKGSRP